MEIGNISIIDDRVHISGSGDIWLSQHEIADLFGCFVSKVNTNIRSILKGEVLDEAKVCRTYRYGNGNSVEQYNQEMVIALSFRIRSYNADTFRKFIVRKAIVETSIHQVLVYGNWNQDVMLN